MPTFDARADYNPRRDVRGQNHKELLSVLRSPPQQGVLYPLVAARRAGKTWTLRALELLQNKDETRAKYVDLRNPDGLPQLESLDCQCLLLDEPKLADAGHGVHDPAEFLDWCKLVHRKGITILLAMSPAEWAVLQCIGEPRAMVSPHHLRFLKPLDSNQAAKLARNKQATDLLPALPANWKTNPFLLELVFQVAEELGIDAGTNVWELLRQVRDRSQDAEFGYFRSLFDKGLTENQQVALRSVACASNASSDELDLLRRCGFVRKEEARLVLADPILEANLSPLRIHHVSDLHFGPKSAKRVDVKAKGAHADRLASGLGPNSVAHDYLGHLEKLKQDGLAPHLLVISGDVAEWAKDAEFAEAKQWILQAQRHLGEHPRLPPDVPHVLLVGGNHDVDWGQTDGTSGARKRHLPFARAFEGMDRVLRIRLEEPPETRKLTIAKYADLGIEVLLLGSAEFGGEDETDPVRLKLLDLMLNLHKGALSAADEEHVANLASQRSKIDPGLVHNQDLQRIRGHQWHQPVRIAVLHHPVSPLPTTELKHFVGLINAGEVKDRLIERGFSLVLHGHAHTGCFFKEQWPGKHGDKSLWIVSAPSLGSSEIQEHNGYNEVEIVRDTKEKEVTYSIKVRRHGREGTNWPMQGAPMVFEIPPKL